MLLKQKNVSVKKSKNKWVAMLRRSLQVVLLSALFSNTAFAAQTEVGRIVLAVCDWLSGEVGAAIAALAVIYSGYEMLSGDIEKKRFAVRCIAIGLIVGGAYITNSILGVG